MEGFEYYLDAFRNYADFEGRARRSEYWYFVLFNFLSSFLLVFLVFTLPFLGIAIYFLYAIGIIIPNLALIVRRLHDTNRSGWNFLFSLIPLAGAIIMLVFMTEEGTRGPNDYGPDPKLIPEDDTYL